jgi:uncharacterized protein
MNKEIIQNTIDFVKTKLNNTDSGHDWSHIERVLTNTRKLLKTEEGDPLVCELAALLHDIADPKFHNGDESLAPLMVKDFLEKQGLDDKIIKKVNFIVKYISFKGGMNESIKKTKELKIVQDADRLDAIGAIGIARAFNYGGFKNRKIYDPDISIQLYKNSQSYYSSDSPTIQHFYEKLLLLKDLMNTKTGKILAESRHKYMEEFLEQFLSEWNGLK